MLLGVHSQYFLATSGVKRGKVLSPVLYLLYIDGLLIKLTKSGMGCFFGLFLSEPLPTQMIWLCLRLQPQLCVSCSETMHFAVIRLIVSSYVHIGHVINE